MCRFCLHSSCVLSLRQAHRGITGIRLCPLDSVDIWVDTLSWYSIYYTNCKEGGRIYGSFDVTSGSDVDFFICDLTNYDLWSSGSSSTGYEINHNVGSLSYSLNLPHDGTWYAVFSNDNWLYREHVEGTIYYAAPVTASDYSSLVGVLVILGIIGAVVVCVGIGAHVYSNYVREQKAQLRQSPQPQGSQVYVGPAQSYSLPRFCPSCGTPLRSPNDRFCSMCGRQLGPGSELR